MQNTTEPTFSDYQKAVFEFIQTGNGNAVINAVAGSGKTFTITHALSLIPTSESVLFLAFNKHIVKELQEKVNKKNLTNVDVMTVHSYGSKVLWNNIKSKLDADKIWKTIDTLFPTWDIQEDIKKGYIVRVKRLIELAKMNLCNDSENLFQIALKHDIEIFNGEIEHAIEVLRITDKNLRVHDFNDMVYFPTRHNLNGKTYDWVFIDECQDLSKAQQSLMQRALKENGRFIAVGDPHQCIYGFAGADVDSFKNLQNQPNTISLPLSLTYRCAKNIVSKAQVLVPHIQSLPEAEEGIVRYNGKIEELSNSDMVLSRVNRPLITLCLQLLGDGKKAYVKGKDIGTNLANMLKKTKKKSFEDAMKELISQKTIMINKLLKRGTLKEDAENSVVVQTYQDKLDALDALGKNLKSVDDVIQRILKIFSDENEGICLSTVHKAKGLESNRVFIVEPAKMPATWARKDWEKEQESNIEYVAYTRAKNELVIVPESEFTTYEK
jgi:DNA helicase-2/ATP-dependent DNA helicase PcrA